MLKILYAAGCDWEPRVLTAMDENSRLYSYFYGKDWEPEWLGQLATTGVRQRGTPAKRDWGNETYMKRRRMAVVRKILLRGVEAEQ